MKKLILCMIMCLPLCVNAQSKQLGVLAGYKVNEGLSATLGYYYLWDYVQFGPVLEVTQATNTLSGNDILYVAPGAAFNVLFPFGKVGFAYPGMTVRYRLWDGYHGIEYGFTVGAAYQINKRMGLNFETGYRIFNVSERVENTLGGTTSSRYSGQNIPLSLGLRILL